MTALDEEADDTHAEVADKLLELLKNDRAGRGLWKSLRSTYEAEHTGKFDSFDSFADDFVQYLAMFAISTRQACDTWNENGERQKRRQSAGWREAQHGKRMDDLSASVRPDTAHRYPDVLQRMRDAEAERYRRSQRGGRPQGRDTFPDSYEGARYRLVEEIAHVVAGCGLHRHNVRLAYGSNPSSFQRLVNAVAKAAGLTEFSEKTIAVAIEDAAGSVPEGGGVS